MGKTTSNIGQTGVESIRLAGMKIEDLPIAEAARVQPQIAIAYDTERQNKINGVMKKYPTQRVDYLEGRIKECKTNQENMARLALTEQQRIMDYQGHGEMCKHRDRMIAKLDPVADAEEIKALKRQFPYIIDRLEAQIEISKGSIERFNKVVQRESGDIAELSEVLGVCKQRDLELANLGVKQAVG
jgi:hypothetical protein